MHAWWNYQELIMFLTIVMLTKKDILRNWTERRMCGDYRLVNKCTRSDKYAMPLLEEIFDVLG
jgi:hypothetical protein